VEDCLDQPLGLQPEDLEIFRLQSEGLLGERGGLLWVGLVLVGCAAHASVVQHVPIEVLNIEPFQLRIKRSADVRRNVSARVLRELGSHLDVIELADQKVLAPTEPGLPDRPAEQALVSGEPSPPHRRAGPPRQWRGSARTHA